MIKENETSVFGISMSIILSQPKMVLLV